ncbi:STAS domain-containing protein [Fictibacillus enclensis]|uniref:STAS domain-containing protein n=1 Tax=Fictibacillus enclensis TaxID=1017270 RepID=UPI0024C09A44|nr:STAS domain-containing protein [Fictibacillus enclensis]WHY71930.1 RsbR, positive regulator of sigma-B [Fictibacillus enclensis]
MDQIGINISNADLLNSIGEVIIISDTEYRIVWVNKKAEEVMKNIYPLYGLNSIDEIIGKNMDFFHKNPKNQRFIMDKGIKDGHKARINIKSKIIADIIITPIQDNKELVGYTVMLMDMTTKDEEERRKDQLIQKLSVPILHIWDKTIALPLYGDMNVLRGEHIISTVLQECVDKRIRYVMLSLAGVTSFDETVHYNLNRLTETLRLIGVQSIIVGINPDLALAIQERIDAPIFKDAHSGLKYIINLEKDNENS